MSTVLRFLTSRWGPIITGLVIGILAPLLVKWGNPGNMGICMACFTRDIAGALGLHNAGVVQYVRPEIIGGLLGAFCRGIRSYLRLPRYMADVCAWAWTYFFGEKLLV